MAFNLTSKAFEHGAAIPDKHSCKGEDLPPPLSWDEAPGGTVTFALILEDPDAPGGTFLHWLIYNIPPDAKELNDVSPAQKNLKNGAIQAKNDFGKTGYGGPCPPKGEEHRYFFKLFALKKKLQPESIRKIEDFYHAIKSITIDKAEYMGKFRL
ncbi:MAG TPA: YbhB/YbcL family Raf kinase inhibitor-like protein [Mariniphaga sp.]|nr:YbhB/YbcL family Raf kinase inhibitor-like protein [Mariniphaga sp.]